MLIASAAIVLGLLAPAEPPPTVAVAYFDNNTAKPEFDPLAKGLTDMIITDLVGLEGIRVVERAQLNHVLAELELSQSKFIDPKTALKLGHGLAASYLITGSYMLAEDTLRLDARVLEVKTGTVLAAESVTGGRLEFFALEQRLAARLVPALKGATQGAAPRRSAATKSFDAWVQYSTGLDAEDRGEAARAQQMFEQALKLDPGYQAAKSAQERLAILFSRRDQAALSAVDEALAGLAPSTPDFPQKVDDVLASLDDIKFDQLSRKIKLLHWLGERRLLACVRREGPATGNPGILVNGVPMGGVVSYCQQAGDVLKITYQLIEDKTQRGAFPKVCEYFIQQLPGDQALFRYCQHLIAHLPASPGTPEKESDREKRRAKLARLPPTDRRRVLDDIKALLAVYANNLERPGAAPTPR